MLANWLTKKSQVGVRKWDNVHRLVERKKWDKSISLKLISAFFRSFIMLYLAPPKRVLAPVIFSFKTSNNSWAKTACYFYASRRAMLFFYNFTVCVYLLSLWHFYYDFNSKQHQNVDEFSISLSQNGKKTHTQRKSRGYHNNFYVEKKR